MATRVVAIRGSIAALGLVVSLASCAAPPVPSTTPGSSSTTASTSPAGTPSSAAVDWHDPDQPAAARAMALLAEMTLDEKIGQMTQLEEGSVQPHDVTDLFLGSVLSGGGGAPLQNDAVGWYRMVATYQDAALETRLAIPMLYGVDAVHGHNNVIGATIFPHNVGLGAAHDPALVTRIGQATAAEMIATGIRWDFGPVVAVPQDVRWGRTYEGYGQDPTLVSQLGSAFITGLQGPDLSAPTAVAATAKHFLGDGGTGWGTSTTPGYHIDQGVTDVDDATLRATHLAPYQAAIDAGARIVMASFSSTAAGKVHGDRHLLTDLLKGELGFSGFVVSDWAGVDQVDPDYAAAVAKAIGAGIDMVMVPTDGRRFQQAVRDGLAAKTIDPARIDDAVARILRVKFELGLFEEPIPVAGGLEAVGTDDHRALARQAVAESAVLLKASPEAVPLATDQDVLIAGSGANDVGRQSGGWTISWQGSDGPITPGTTIANGLRARLGDHLIAFDPDPKSNVIVHAPVGIVVVSEPPYAEGKGDSATLELPAADLEAVAGMRDHVDQLIVVIVSGRPVMLDRIQPLADVIVAAWLPGTEGAGIADVLFGDQPFQGTTPYAWPSTPADAPRTGKAPCEGAWFPVGFGLDAAGKLLGPKGCVVGL